MIGKFCGNRKQTFHKEGPRSGQEFTALRVVLHFHPKSSLFRDAAPDCYAFPLRKDPNTCPGKNRNCCANYIFAPLSGPGMA